MAVCRTCAEAEDTEERRRGYKGRMRAWFAATNAALDSAAARWACLGCTLSLYACEESERNCLLEVGCTSQEKL